MVGGADIVIPIEQMPDVVLDAATRYILRMWPHALIEDVRRGELHERYHTLAFGNVRELMIYKDRYYFDRWEELGADPSHDNTMIHLICRDSDLTLVLDDSAQPEARVLIRGVNEILRMDILNFMALRRAA